MLQLLHKITSTTIAFLLCTTSAFAAMKFEDEGTNQGYINALNIAGAGVSATKSGIKGTITVDVPSAEADTLDTVCDRGSTTDQNITAGSLDVGASTLSSRALTVDTGGVFNVALSAAAGDDFTVDTNKLVVEGDTGNVGIGTATPVESLHMLSAVGRNYIKIQDTRSSAGDNVGLIFSTYNNFNKTIIAHVETGSFGTGDIVFVLDGAGDANQVDLTSDEKVRFTSAGNVGIGTTAPATLTEIRGGLTTVGSILTLGSKETTTVANDVLGRINFYAPLDGAGTDAILVAGSIVAQAEGTFAADSNATSLLFQTGSSEVATTKMTLTSAGALTVTGDISGNNLSGSNTGDNTVATSGDAAEDFFGAGVNAVTDATTCTDIEGTGLSITTGVLNWKDPSTHSKSFTILDPVATDDVPLWEAPYALTLSAIHVQLTGGTNIVGGLDEYDSAGATIVAAVDADITATAGASVDDDGSLTNGTIAAGNYLFWHTTSISGTPTSATISFNYTVD